MLATLLALLLAIGGVPSRIPQDAPQSRLAELTVGHWLELRGRFGGDQHVASRVDLKQPERYQRLVGTVSPDSVVVNGFTLFEQPVRVSERVKWKGVLQLSNLGGRRIGLKGRWRGPGRFSAREIRAWGSGRDRIEGRVDSIRRGADGIHVTIMGLSILLPPDVEVRFDAPLEELQLAPRTEITAVGKESFVVVDDDDLFGDGILLADGLVLESQLTLRSALEDEFDLDENKEGNRFENEASLRTRLIWEPGPSFYAIAELGYRFRWRDDEKDGITTEGDARLGETFAAWRNPFGFRDVELSIGRQDFDDTREWIYDQNLDALRLNWRRPGLEFDLSASTTLADGSRRDKSAHNWLAYLSNGEEEKHLALWATHRRIRFDGVAEENLHVGLRAIGDWVPQSETWLDVARLTGERNGADVDAWGYDAGITWTPERWSPYSFTLGYALGSGDRSPSASSDATFRQTGLQDNDARFGGVTSFRYYGELFDPELSNLGVVTVGVGSRLSRDASVDLVYHRYVQDHAQPSLGKSDLRAKPDGIDPDIGWELDLVLGLRGDRFWSFEAVGALFEPGDAFPGADSAYLLKLQLRLRK